MGRALHAFCPPIRACGQRHVAIPPRQKRRQGLFFSVALIFTRDHHPFGTVGLPPAAERLCHSTKFGSSSPDSFRAGPATGTAVTQLQSPPQAWHTGASLMLASAGAFQAAENQITAKPGAFG